MRFPPGVILAVLIAGGAALPALSAEDVGSTLVVTTLPDSFELSVPVSNLMLDIPKGNLALAEGPQSGATASPRYFFFTDDKQGLIVTGWFESASSWSGYDSFLKGEFAAMKKSGVVIHKAPDEVAAGPWLAFAYDVDVPGSGTSSANVRAELVRAGTWIDIHISVTSRLSAGEQREKAVQVLRSITIKEKP